MVAHFQVQCPILFVPIRIAAFGRTEIRMTFVFKYLWQLFMTKVAALVSVWFVFVSVLFAYFAYIYVAKGRGPCQISLEIVAAINIFAFSSVRQSVNLWNMHTICLLIQLIVRSL